MTPSEYQQSFSDIESTDFVAGSVFGFRQFTWEERTERIVFSRSVDNFAPLGYRYNEPDRKFVLQGANKVSWTSAEMTAQCLREIELDKGCSQDPDGKSPGENCTCGIYAYWTPPEYMLYGPAVSSIYAVVEATGRVFIGSKGFRAQHAKIVAVSVGYDNYYYSVYIINRLRAILPDTPFYPNIWKMLEKHPTTKDYIPKTESAPNPLSRLGRTIFEDSLKRKYQYTPPYQLPSRDFWKNMGSGA